MPEIIFSHPAIDPRFGRLHISTGANEITWGYGLNTQTYPTFGGEVVQILSAYTDDLTVQGEITTYTAMERIYEWFLHYIQVATQGGDQDTFGSFNQTPIHFSYPLRGWEQDIIITELPGFKYGRDVVIPQYQIKAHVVEQHGALNQAIIDATSTVAFQQRGIDLVQFGRVTAEVGYVEDSPFSTPFPQVDPDKVDQRIRDLYEKLGDYFTTILGSYTQGDFGNKLVDYGSVPAFLGGGDGSDSAPRNNVGTEIDGNK